MVKMAVYIIVSVVFGFIVGQMFANTKNRESNVERDDKFNKIISNKNGIIIKLKNDARSLERKSEASTQGYDLQRRLYEKLELENKMLRGENKELLHLQNENRELSNSLGNKVKLLDKKDEIITLLERKIA